MIKKKINKDIQKLSLASKLEFEKFSNIIHKKIIYSKNKIIPKVQHCFLIKYFSAWSKQKMKRKIGFHSHNHNILDNLQAAYGARFQGLPPSSPKIEKLRFG